MNDLVKLRSEHAELLEIVQRLASFVVQPVPPAAGDLFKLRNELTSALIGHLKAEDWVLYPQLLASPHAAVAETARKFSDEMGGLADAFRTYTNKWTALSIAYHWSGYCEETRIVIEALVNRISRENRDLYPLWESLKRAA